MTLWMGFLLWALSFHALGWYLTGFNIYAFGTGIMFAYLMSEIRDWYREAIK